MNDLNAADATDSSRRASFAERETEERQSLLEAGAQLLAEKPYAAVTLQHIAVNSGTDIARVTGYFPTLHQLASSILDHERRSMHVVQHRVAMLRDPVERLLLTFRWVGDNLANDIIVRAGVRLAAESRDAFPERRLDPFATWEGFVSDQLAVAQADGLLPAEVDAKALTWLLVAAAMGTKDLIAFRDRWSEAPQRLEATLSYGLILAGVNTSRTQDESRVPNGGRPGQEPE